MLNWSCRHRQHFRSDVLVTFNPPMVFSVKNNPELLAPVDYDKIRALTARMHQEISSRTIDAPSWDLVRVARLAARIYAPLGTRMSLGDYVRVTKTFVEAFKVSHPQVEGSETDEKVEVTKEDEALMALHRDLKVGTTFGSGMAASDVSSRFTKTNSLVGVSKMTVSDAHLPVAQSSHVSSSDSGGPCSSLPSQFQDYSSGFRSSSQLSTPCAISKSQGPSGIPGMKLLNIS